jgi:hypothetical protein
MIRKSVGASAWFPALFLALTGMLEPRTFIDRRNWVT